MSRSSAALVAGFAGAQSCRHNPGKLRSRAAAVRRAPNMADALRLLVSRRTRYFARREDAPAVTMRAARQTAVGLEEGA
jgi:hypothetical protein